MIKLFVKNELKLIIGAVSVFLISFILQLNLAIAIFLVSLYAYAKSRRAGFNNLNLLNVIFLIVVGFTSSYFIIKEGLALSNMPFWAIPMLAALLFANLEISLLIALAVSFSAASISSFPFATLLLSLTGGLFSALLVRGARKRVTIINAGLIAGLSGIISLVCLDGLRIFQPNRYLILLVNGIVSSIIVLGVLPAFEYLFKTVTNISLLELADFHHPLLQRLTLEAPGTYHHSLVVGNMSENACQAIGANALLARIGAYYHDIGKLQKPEYFSENQAPNLSKHDTLSASMSKLIIMNHVKEGVELARKYKLSPPLLDFISQHHGNSLVYYFYRRALESLEEDQEVKEEGFRYAGPKPGTKETAVVLLADSVEAAARALKDPSPARIEELVHKIINNKFIDGQLDECDLTLKDLEKISAVFIRILSGIYHSRVSYPEEPGSENNHKKFPKADPHQSEKDKGSNP